jgi:hypothetical protein
VAGLAGGGAAAAGAEPAGALRVVTLNLLHGGPRAQQQHVHRVDRSRGARAAPALPPTAIGKDYLDVLAPALKLPVAGREGVTPSPERAAR